MTDENRTFWVVEWTYSPSHYLEAPFEIVHEGYELTIQNGKAEAKIYTEHGDPRPNLRDQLHTHLSLMFAGIQLLSHQPYALSLPSVYRRHPNGKRDIFLESEPIVLRISLHGDITITDREGNVVGDSRAERIEKKRLLATLAATHGTRDPVARRILQSYSEAVTDPGNELVHLYEIREALEEVFGGKEPATSTLKISNKRWKELGRLANDAPLKQGRHRGKRLSGLRDASADELGTARNIAREMVENYLRYLDER